MAFRRGGRRFVPRRRPVVRHRRHHVRRTRGRGARSTRNFSAFRSQGLPLELGVKFPFYYSANLYGPATGENRRVIVGNSLNPAPAVLQGIVGTPPSSTLWSAGDAIVPGYSEYAGFYGTSVVTFSKWNLEFINMNATNTYQLCVVVAPYETNVSSDPSPASLLAQIAAFDAMAFDDLASQPYARVQFLNVSGSGHERAKFSISRSTRQMIRCKNVMDRQALVSEPVTATNSGTQGLPFEGWFIYMRAYIGAGGSVMDYDINFLARGVVYTQLVARAPLPLFAFPSS